MPNRPDNIEDVFRSQTGDEEVGAASPAGPALDADDVDPSEENEITLNSPLLEQLFPGGPPRHGPHPPLSPPLPPPRFHWEHDHGSDDGDSDGDGDEYEEERDAEGGDSEAAYDDEDEAEDNAEDDAEGNVEGDSQASKWSTTDSSSEDEEEEEFLPYDNFPNYREGSPAFKDDDDAAYWRGEADREIQPEQHEGRKKAGKEKRRDKADKVKDGDGSDEDGSSSGSDKGELDERSDGERDGEVDEGETSPGDGRRKKKKKKEVNREPPDINLNYIGFPPVGFAWGGEPTVARGGDEFPGLHVEDNEPRESKPDEGPPSAWSKIFLQPDDVSEVTESSQRSDGIPKVSHYIVEFPVGRVGSWEDGSDGFGYIPPSRVHEYRWKENRKYLTGQPSEGILAEIDGATEAMAKIRRIGAEDFLKRFTAYYDHAMLSKIKMADSFLLAHKQIRHDRRFIRGMNDFIRKMERSMDHSTTDLRLSLARALLENSKLRDQIEMMKQGIDLEEDEFLRPDDTEERDAIVERVKRIFPHEEEEGSEKEEGEEESETEGKKESKKESRREKKRRRRERRRTRASEREEEREEGQERVAEEEGDRVSDRGSEMALVRFGDNSSDRDSDEWSEYSYSDQYTEHNDDYKEHSGEWSDFGGEDRKSEFSGTKKDSEFGDGDSYSDGGPGGDSKDDAKGDSEGGSDGESEVELDEPGTPESPKTSGLVFEWPAEMDPKKLEREQLEWSVLNLRDDVARLRKGEERMITKTWQLQATILELNKEIELIRNGDPVPSEGIIEAAEAKAIALKKRALAAETLLESANIEKRRLKKELDEEEAHSRLLEEIAAKYEKDIREKAREIEKLEALTDIPITDKFEEFIKSVREAAGGVKGLGKDEDGNTVVERSIAELEARLSLIEAGLPIGVGSIKQHVFLHEARVRVGTIKKEVLDLLREAAKTKAIDSMALEEAAKAMEVHRDLLEENLDLMHRNTDLEQDVRERERQILQLNKFKEEAKPWKDRIRELEKADKEKDAALRQYQEFTRKLPMGAVVAFTEEQLQKLLKFLPTVAAYYSESRRLEEAMSRVRLFVPSDNADFNTMLEQLVRAFAEQALRQEMCDSALQSARVRLAIVEEREKQINSDKVWLLGENARYDHQREELKAAADMRQTELEAARREMMRQQEESSQQLMQTTRELSDKMEAMERYKEEVDSLLREKKGNYEEVVAALKVKQNEADAEVEKMRQTLADQTKKNEEAAKLLDENNKRLAQEREAEQQEMIKWQGKHKEIEDEKTKIISQERQLQEEIDALRNERLTMRARAARLRIDRAAMAAMLAEELEQKRRLAGELTAQEVEGLREQLQKESHPSEVCFCALLKFFLPDVYNTVACERHPKKTATQRTLAEELVESPPPAPPILSHGHGHSALLDLWPYLCQLLTSTVWIVLLLLLHARNLYDYFWFAAIVIVGLPLYMLRVLVHYLQISYRRIRRVLPNSLRRVLPFPAPRRELPAFWLLKTPSASAIVGIVFMSFFALSLLAAQAVRVERRIWLGRNNWRMAYIRDIETMVPYPQWWPAEVDFRLAVEPLLGPLVELAYEMLFEVQKGVRWGGFWGVRALKTLEGWR